MLASGVLLALAASIVLLQLPVAWPLRVLAELLWWIGSSVELWRGWRQYQHLSGFCLHADGSVDVEAPDGTRCSAAMSTGTVSLSNLAWFRCRGTNGRVYAELIARSSQERDEWRRFRVICRHVAAC